MAYLSQLTVGAKVAIVAEMARQAKNSFKQRVIFYRYTQNSTRKEKDGKESKDPTCNFGLKYFSCKTFFFSPDENRRDVVVAGF